jgi:16S rRNA (adenine1518-N6/adenine1519-N6)-dimethyltransferase
LERHGWRPLKRLGQHFLVSEAVVAAIARELEGYAGLLEIGPGPGVLTQPLSERAERMIALEVDSIAVRALAESAPRAEVRHQDALSSDLRAIFAELPSPRALVSNMPYNLTGPLFGVFAAARGAYDRAVLMMQREVGEKAMARAGSPEYGGLSVFLQAQFAIRRVTTVPPGAFFPPPKVESVVLRLDPLPASPNEEFFFALVREGFAQPRKTLANNLANRLAREDLSRWLSDRGHKTTARPHELDLEDWRALAAWISRPF